MWSNRNFSSLLKILILMNTFTSANHWYIMNKGSVGWPLIWDNQNRSYDSGCFFGSILSGGHTLLFKSLLLLFIQSFLLWIFMELVISLKDSFNRDSISIYVLPFSRLIRNRFKSCNRSSVVMIRQIKGTVKS